MDKKLQKECEQLAEKNYEPDDYKRNCELSSGLATTHEQVSDTLKEGTIDRKIKEEEIDISLRHK